MINLSIPKDEQELKPRITVVGVGGAGGNAVNNMIRSNLVGCDFVATNTDAQALQLSNAPRKIQLAIEALHLGGVAAYPTDSIYALGCAIEARGAIERRFTVQLAPRLVRGVETTSNFTPRQSG